MGDHELTLGTSNQIFSFMNKFVQDDYGSYIFDSIEDFKNGIPFRYRYSYLMEGGNASAEFTGLQLGFYAQDKWKADRKSTRLNSSHVSISYAVFCPSPTLFILFPYTTLFRSIRSLAL